MGGAGDEAPTAVEAAEAGPVDGPRSSVTESADALVDGLEGPPGRRRRVQRLLLANRALADELALPALYRRTTERAGWLVDASTAWCAVIGADEHAVQVLRWDGRGAALAMPLSEPDETAITALARTLERRQIRRLAWRRPIPGMTLPWRSGAMVVPLYYRSDLLAILVLEAPAGRRFTPVDREAMSSYAVTAGIAIENARAYEQSRRRQDWLAAATALVTGPLATAGAEGGLRLVVDEVRGLADADRVLFWPDATRPGRVLIAGPEAGTYDHGVDVSLETRHPMVTAALEEGRGLCATVPVKPRDPFTRGLGGLGLGPILLVGWDGTDEAGFMVVGRARGRTPYSRFDLDLVTSFTAQMQTATELQQARIAMRRASVLEERERMAGSLHHTVVEDLRTAGARLQSVRLLSSPPAQSRLDEVAQLVDASIANLRRSISTLRTHPGEDPAADAE